MRNQCKSTWLLVFYAIILSCLIHSCNKDDNEPSSEWTSFTISELESTPSFVYSYTSAVSSKYSYDLYLWFRDGRMNVFKNGSTSSRSSAQSYKYTLDGQNIIISRTNILGETTTYKGYLSKYVNGDKKQLVLSRGLDGTNIGDLPDDYLHWYDYSSIKISN